MTKPTKREPSSYDEVSIDHHLKDTMEEKSCEVKA